MKEKEVWKPVHFAKKYEISNYGRLRNTETNNCLKGKIDKDGYVEYQISLGPGKNKYVRGHRLVGFEFVPGRSKERNQINHKDGVRNNNYYKNLEWVSPSENTRHSIKMNWKNHFSPVEVFDIKTKEVFKLDSIKALSSELGLKSTILSYLKKSDNTPINGRYVVKLINDTDLNDRSNSIIFGIPIYVYDFIEDKTTKYSSKNIARYHTGLKSLGVYTSRGLDVHNEELGYSYSVREDKLNKDFKLTKEEILKNRELYFNKPYKVRDYRYLIRNNFNRTVKEFDKITQVIDYIEQETGVKVKNARISECVHLMAKGKLEYTVLGMSICTSKDPCTWYNFSDQEIVSKILNDRDFKELYSVKEGKNTRYFYTLKSMSEYFGITLKENDTYYEYVEKVFMNNPNVTIRKYG